MVSGWPHGPNALAMDAMIHCHKAWKEGKFQYKAALLMEADCVPLTRTWIDDLGQEWDGQTKSFLGHWDGSGKVIKAPTSHMNGNLLFHPSIIDHPEINGCVYGEIPRNGWDMNWWQRMAPHCTPSRLIFSDYKLNTANNPLPNPERLFMPRFHAHPDNPLHGQELHPSWVHGCKGLKAQQYVRAKLLT